MEEWYSNVRRGRRMSGKEKDECERERSVWKKSRERVEGKRMNV